MRTEKKNKKTPKLMDKPIKNKINKIDRQIGR